MTGPIVVAAAGETVSVAQPAISTVSTGRPTGPGYIGIETLQAEDPTIGTDVQKASNRLRATGRLGLCLTLPPGEFVRPDFGQGYRAGLRVWNRGLVGSLDATGKAVSRIGVNPMASPPANVGGISYCQVQCMDVPGQTLELGNLMMVGYDQGGLLYNGVYVGATSGTTQKATVYNIQSDATNPGWRGNLNQPPGEAGLINVNHCDHPTVSGVHVDARNGAGVRVGSSPIMFNYCVSPLGQDCDLQYAVAGMPTFYACSDPSWLRTRSAHNGSGSGHDKLSGSCFNFELCTGVGTIDGCVLTSDYGVTANAGLHVSSGNSAGQAPFTIRVLRSIFDAGPKPGSLAVQIVGEGGTKTAPVVTCDSAPVVIYN